MAKSASIIEIKNYFGWSGREVTPVEMRQFWGELSEDEKNFYKDGVGAILEAQQN